jgi:Flp pilus assembly protein TadD
LGKFDAALPHLLRATRLTPDSADSWNNLGVLYAKMGRFEEAQQALEKALDVNPDFERARASLEKVHRQIAPAAPAQ